MSDISPKELIETVAYHEAGHAVMALKFRFQVTRIDLLPDSSSGYVSGIKYPNIQKLSVHSNAVQDITYLMHYMRFIHVLLAGPITEAEFRNKPYEKILHENRDFDNILEYLTSESFRDIADKYKFQDL